MEETPRSGSVRYKQGEAGLCIFPEAMAGNDPSLCRVKSELQGGVGARAVGDQSGSCCSHLQERAWGLERPQRDGSRRDGGQWTHLE